MKKILLVGCVNEIETNFLYWLVYYIKKNCPELCFDLYNIRPLTPYEKNKAKVLFESVYEYKSLFPKFVYKVKGVASLARILDNIILFKKLKSYPVANVHGITSHSMTLLRVFGKRFNFILVTPYGSDIYRDKRLLYIKKKVIERADYITVFNDNRLKEDIIKILNLQAPPLFEDIGFGSDIIEHLCNDNSLTREAAKIKLELDNKYVIVCGYNGHQAQRHIEIIKSIGSVKNNLPSNFVLVFPMTYGVSDAYFQDVKQTLEDQKFPHRIYLQFLSAKQTAYLRKSADIFIHAQATDAFSASVQEHILAGTTVINGSWVSYPGLEKYGKPYILFDSFDDLGPALVSVVDGTASYEVNEKLLQEIRDKSWTVVAEKWGGFYKRLISSTS